ncbi:response regulator transcription factor [Thalassomonas viridans]|uniref:Response regulator transcription factor n=1 Tax=Thalassomonas viridans TaxID=137584 RepID=A0AAF0CFT4_9GAMM|nr:response regulator transcription factor [Thalassomonas viridans]
MKILIIEDNIEINTYICNGLRQAGHSVNGVTDGNKALIEASHGHYDVLVIDRVLPGLDGLSIIKALRAMGKRTPSLMLSALIDVAHRVEGLRAGADDYLSKPFYFSELLARIESLNRRNLPVQQDTVLQVDSLQLDLLGRQVKRGQRIIELLPREYTLLEYLMKHSGQVVTRTMLLETLWGFNFDPQTNIVDVHISRIRKKIDGPTDKPLLHTVRGVGYVIRAKSCSPPP